MSRPQPVLEPDTCHHITVRRNNREFNLIRQACRDLMLKRSGHFWEGRSRSSSFPEHEPKRALNTLRHIYANRKTAGMRKSHFYAYSYYGIYPCLTDDGLTEWHRAFLAMGQNMDACQRRYQRFCQRNSPKKKEARRVCSWGSRLFLNNLPKTSAGLSPVKPNCSKSSKKAAW